MSIPIFTKILVDTADESASLLRMNIPKCRKCHVTMKSGMAIQNTLRYHPDFPGDTLGIDGQTVTADGKPVMIPCWKCPKCGHSITARKYLTSV